MFNIRIVQANYGDCLIIEYGEQEAPRFALIDGGPRDVYRRHLKGEIRKIADAGGTLEFLAISHVDGDHITGVLDLFAELEAQRANGEDPLCEISEVWHNSFANTLDRETGLQTRFMRAMSAAHSSLMVHSTAAVNGIWQGNQLRIKTAQLGIPVNNRFPDDLIITDTAPDPIDLDGLVIRIVGPSRENLETLRGEWEAWLEENEPNFVGGDPVTMANSDDSVPNLSSLMFLVEAHDKTALFTGDGRSDHLLEGLRAAQILDNDGRLHVDVLKVMHHGSDRNVTKRFFETVTADIYIVSANGHPDNPDLSTLIWMVEAAKHQDRQIKIIATNKTRAIRKLQDEYPSEEYNYELDIMPQHWSYKLVELSE